MTQTVSWITANHIWYLIGFCGQALFTSRFIVQWFRSEIEGKSVIPVAFWYFSVGGGIVLLAYAIHLKDPVIITGQAGGLVVYFRNLYFIFRDRTTAPTGT